MKLDRPAGDGRRAGAGPTARPGARWSPPRPRRRRCRPAASSGSSASRSCSPRRWPTTDARAELAASRTRLVEGRRRGRAGGSSARCTRARTSTSSRSRSSCASRCGRAHARLAEEAVLRDVLADAMEASAERWASSRAGCIPRCSPSAGSPPRCRRSCARAAAPVNLRALPGRRFSAVIETTAYLLVAEAIANAAAPRPRDRVHAARRRRRRPADGRGPRQRHRRRRRSRPGGGLECLGRPRGGARRRASRSTRRAAAARRSGSRSPLNAERLALLVPRPDPLRRSGHERAPQQRRRTTSSSRARAWPTCAGCSRTSTRWAAPAASG